MREVANKILLSPNFLQRSHACFPHRHTNIEKVVFAATLRRIRNFLDLQLCKSLRLRLSSAKHLDSILPR